MNKRWSILPALILLVATAHAQVTPVDSTVIKKDKDLLIDTSINYDELFQDFDSFMDSILSPHNYFLASLSAAKGYYNFENKNTYQVTVSKKLTYSPVLGYFHKSGLGISGTGYLVDDGAGMNFFQGSITGSYDYLQNKKLATGFSYTRFFTKDSLSFYTTPIQNELYAYFTYRKWWVRPTIAVSYGWGSRTEYHERETLIQDLRLRRRGYTYINTEETISDFSLMASVRHDFYWLDVFTYRDHIRFTPQVTFTSGTQKFGFNQSSTTYAGLIRNTSNPLYYTDNYYLDDELNFQPLSVTLFLRGEYSISKFFFQPQMAFDYYFPASTNKFNTIFSINLGVMF